MNPIVMILVAALDQLTKYIVLNNLKAGEQFPIIQDYFHIMNFKNTFALLHTSIESTVITELFTAVLLLCLLYYLVVLIKDEQLKLPLSLAYGGALGNIIDSFYRGGVIDFLAIRIFNAGYILNLADIFICIGGIMICKRIISYNSETYIGLEY